MCAAVLFPSGTTLTGPCTTISIGFRAPNYQSLVTAMWEEVCSQKLSDDNSFYADGGVLTQAPASPALISAEARAQMQSDVHAKVAPPPPPRRCPTCHCMCAYALPLPGEVELQRVK